MTVTLATINTAAADLISKAGWTQRTERDDAGRVCLTGALRFCRPQPGDSHLARGVYRTLGHGEDWNDDDDRTAVEVITYLRTHPVTDDLLAATYGPQWQHVVALIRRAALLNPDEVKALSVAPLKATRTAARTAAWNAALTATWNAAKKTGRTDAEYAAWNAAAPDVRAAAAALSVRDLLLATPDGTAHYKTLTRPWASVIGPVHPDDEPVTA